MTVSYETNETAKGVHGCRSAVAGSRGSDFTATTREFTSPAREFTATTREFTAPTRDSTSHWRSHLQHSGAAAAASQARVDGAGSVPAAAALQRLTRSEPPRPQRPDILVILLLHSLGL
eukprot:1184052-Prorocentrum_minimum.AAC.6